MNEHDVIVAFDCRFDPLGIDPDAPEQVGLCGQPARLLSPRYAELTSATSAGTSDAAAHRSRKSVSIV